MITGATGQLGRAVVKQLAKRVAAERIGVFVRDERKAADLKEQGVKLFVGTTMTSPRSTRPCAGSKKSS